jgi:hypothetical protein
MPGKTDAQGGLNTEAQGDADDHPVTNRNNYVPISRHHDSITLNFKFFRIIPITLLAAHITLANNLSAL